jgi:serpin B
MTANGADGETRAQMESVLGMPAADLNGWIRSYTEKLPAGEKYRLSLANSVWFTDQESFNVNPDFLQTNADYYGADIFRVPFDDSTCREINKWVEDNTDGLVKDILDQIPADAVMYLVNALAFDAEWQTVYRENQISTDIFTAASGEERKAEMMVSDEHLYLEDDRATGFLKYYSDRKYAFAALLPKEGITLEEYVSAADGAELLALLSAPQNVPVRTAIPKFETEYSVEVSDILKSMGMTDAFDGGEADFSKLGTSAGGNIFISRVLHKTYIRVDEKGTEAGASTVVEMTKGSVAVEPAELKKVYLNRPFLYMLIDCETNLPIFIGAVTDIGE